MEFSFNPLLRFVCRRCRQACSDTDEFKRHKFEIHREECMKIKCIIFEEQIVGDDPEFNAHKKNPIVLNSESRTKKVEKPTKKETKMKPCTSTTASVPVPVLKPESASSSNNSAARSKYTPKEPKQKPNPYVYVRRLTSEELQSVLRGNTKRDEGKNPLHIRRSGRGRKPYHRLREKSPELNCTVKSKQSKTGVTNGFPEKDKNSTPITKILNSKNKLGRKQHHTDMILEASMMASGTPNTVVSVSLSRLTSQELDRALKWKRKSSKGSDNWRIKPSTGSKIKISKIRSNSVCGKIKHKMKPKHKSAAVKHERQQYIKSLVINQSQDRGYKYQSPTKIQNQFVENKSFLPNKKYIVSSSSGIRESKINRTQIHSETPNDLCNNNGKAGMINQGLLRPQPDNTNSIEVDLFTPKSNDGTTLNMLNETAKIDFRPTLLSSSSLSFAQEFDAALLNQLQPTTCSEICIFDASQEPASHSEFHRAMDIDSVEDEQQQVGTTNENDHLYLINDLDSNTIEKGDMIHMENPIISFNSDIPDSEMEQGQQPVFFLYNDYACEEVIETSPYIDDDDNIEIIELSPLCPQSEN